MIEVDKARLLEYLQARVEADLRDLERRQRDVQAGSTHEESRPEHAKDTRAIEQSYLARGLATRVADLRKTAGGLAAFTPRCFGPEEPIAVGALVVLSTESDAPSSQEPVQPETWWLVAGAGGIELDLDGVRIRTLSPISPLGQALIGLQSGDEGSVRTPRGQRHFEVLRIS
jgi:hypothetical protein